MANEHMESVKIWKGLIQTDRNNPNTWRGLAKALIAAGDTSTAQKCSIKANEIEAELERKNRPPEITVSNPQSNNEVVLAGSQRITDNSESEGLATNLEEAMTANELLARPPQPETTPEPVENPQVDLAKAALDVQTNSLVQEEFRNPASTSIANQDISWYNQGVALIEAGKYAEALSCFDRALPSFSDDDEMVIRILNGRGNAFYYLENYPACVESYHQAMLIKPEEVRGKTLYNMGTAYAEMERYQDAVKCFEQAIPRGLSKDEVKRTKDQIRRCNILIKEQNKKKR